MKNCTDVFAWSQEDLKEYDTSIIQHTIPIRPGEKPFRKKPAGYEAFLLGLNALKYLKEKRIDVFGDSELVVNQVNDSYQTNHPQMKEYRNEEWDMLGNFFTEHRIIVIPRIQNQVDDSLATTTGNFKAPIYSKKKYKIEIVNKPSIPDNPKYWKVFEDDIQIKRFLDLSDEFVNTHIDTKNKKSENFKDNVQFVGEVVEHKKLKNMIGGKDIIQLKINYIPKGILPLDKLFQQNDVAKYPKVQPNENDIQDRILGLKILLKQFNCQKNCLLKKRRNILT